MRPQWDEIWMNVAYQISRRSIDHKLKVGAIIVTDDNTQILSVGYNGDEKGGSNCRDSDVEGESGFIHAEDNALIKMDFNNPKHKKMYVTTSPCIMCARRIINANVNEVIYDQPFRDLTGLNILINAGITVRRFKQQ